MIKMRSFLTAVMVVVSGMFFSTAGAGISRYRFLLVEKNPKITATGGTASAHLSRDMMFIQNPATSQITGKNILYSSYNSWIAGIKTGSFCFLNEKLPVNITLDCLYDRQTSYNSTGGKQGSFTNSQQVLGFSGSRKVFSDFNVGSSIKILRSKLGSYTENDFCFDIGLFSVVKGIELGTTANNMGRHYMPRSFSFSLGKELIENRLKLGAESLFVVESEDIYRLGATLRLAGEVLFYCGLRTRNERWSEGDYSIGMGFVSERANLIISFVPVRELGSSLQAMVGIKY